MKCIDTLIYNTKIDMRRKKQLDDKGHLYTISHGKEADNFSSGLEVLNMAEEMMTKAENLREAAHVLQQAVQEAIDKVQKENE